MSRHSMMRGPLVLLSIGVVAQSFLAGCALTPARPTNRSESGTANQVRARLAQIFDAAEKKYFQRLDSYNQNGPDFSKFSGPGFERQDAAAARAGEHRGLGAIHDLRMHAADLKIDAFARAAIASFILEYEFRAGAETIKKKERATLVLVKRRGQWLIAHEHLSAPSLAK
jgi:hypothetical protein